MLRRATLFILCLLLGSALLQPIAAAAVIDCTTPACTLAVPAACPCCIPAPTPRPAPTCLIQSTTTIDYFLELSPVQLPATPATLAPPHAPILPSTQPGHPTPPTLIQLPAQLPLTSSLAARAPPASPRA